jgi:hypothetical protein
MSPESIYRSLSAGSIAAHANALKLKDDQKRDIAEFLAGRPVGTTQSNNASTMKNLCPAESLGEPFKGPMWNGWGKDGTNARFQTADAAGLTTKMHLACEQQQNQKPIQQAGSAGPGAYPKRSRPHQAASPDAERIANPSPAVSRRHWR